MAVTEIQTVSHSLIASDSNKFWQANHIGNSHPGLAYALTDGTWYSFYSEGNSMSGVSERKYPTYIFVRRYTYSFIITKTPHQPNNIR